MFILALFEVVPKPKLINENEENAYMITLSFAQHVSADRNVKIHWR